MSRGVFGVEEAGEVGAWGHARAFASAQFGAAASFRRGINLSADISGEVGALAELRSVVVGALEVGAAGNASLALQAQVPLDLFGQFGIVARAEASARAAAWVRVEAGLSAEALTPLLTGKLSGPWQELAVLMLRELDVRAGLVARAAVSAEAYGRLIVAGSLVPSNLSQPGFTVVADAGFGWGFGAGYAFLARFGIANTQRLLDGSADVLQRTIIEELRRARVPQLDLIEPVIRVVVPLSLRAAMHSGAALTRPRGAERDADLARAGEEFARALGDALVQVVADWAIRRTSELLAQRLPGFPQIDEDEARRIRLAVMAINGWAGVLPQLAERGTWATPVREICAAVWDLVAIAEAHELDIAPVPDVLACAWAAAALAALRESRDFGAAPPGLADHIRRAVPGDGADLTAADAARFMFARVASLAPPDSPIARITAMYGSLPPSSQVALLEIGLGLSALSDPAEVFDVLAPALKPVLDQQVIPAIESARASASPAASEFLAEAALPALRVLSLLLPDLPKLRNLHGDAALVVRERLSIGILAVSGRVVITLADGLQEFAMSRGVGVARQIASTVRKGARPDVDHRMAAAWNDALEHLPGPDRDLIADLLNLSGDVIHEWNSAVRPRQTQLLRRLIMDITDVLDPEVAAALNDPSRAVGEATLRQLGETTAQGVGALISTSTPKLRQITATYALRQAKSVEVVARMAAEAARQALDELLRTAANLLALAEQLGQEIRGHLAAISSEIAALSLTLSNRVGAAMNGVRGHLWTAMVMPLLSSNVVYRNSPAPLKTSMRQAVRTAYDAAFDSIQWLLQAPLSIVRDGALWTEQILRAQIDASAVDPGRLLSDFRSRALSVAGTTISLPVRASVGSGVAKVTVDLGTVTIGIGTVAAFFADQAVAVLGSAAAGPVRRLTDRAQQVVQATHRRTLAIEQAATAAPLTKADAAALVTGQKPVVRIELHRDGQRTLLDLSVAGVNETYFQAIANLPVRVQVRLDAEVVHVPVATWRAVGSEYRVRLSLTGRMGTLIPVAPFAPLRIRPAKGAPTLVVEGGAVHIALEPDAPVLDPSAPDAGPLPRPVRLPANRHAALNRFSVERAEGVDLTRMAVATAVNPTSAEAAAGIAVHRSKVDLVVSSVTAALPGKKGDSFTWIQAAEEQIPTVPLDAAPGLHIVTVTVADGSGRSASASEIVSIPAAHQA